MLTQPQLRSNEYLIEALRALDITLYAGVIGGGVIHIAKLLEPVNSARAPVSATPKLFTVPEYVAGFVPLGHFLATGRPAACLTTTGAATQLAASGLSDAKAHNIPAVYIVALNATTTYGRSPLQDVSDQGSNIVAQLQAELGDACFHVTDPERLPHQLDAIREHLRASRPVAIAVHPDVLQRPRQDGAAWTDERWPSSTRSDSAAMLAQFQQKVAGRRVVILVADEAGRSPGMRALTTQLAEALGAPTLWTVNGAAGVEATNRYGYGHIGFGGNDAASSLWHSLGDEDVLLALGFEPGEYVLNLTDVPAGHVFHLTNWPSPFGHTRGGFAHRCSGDYVRFVGSLPDAVRILLQATGTVRQPYAPADLNTRTIPGPSRANTVDFAEFLQRVHRSWRRPGIGFDDVSMAYKDRQYVTQRPHPLMRAYAAYQGSAMGGAFGMAVGAKLAAPDRMVACFSGDGCFRLYAGALADTAKLGLRLFVVNNGSYAIVDQGLRCIIPDTRNYHSTLAPIDLLSAAKAFGWDGLRVESDLSNLNEVMDRCHSADDRSLLIEVPVDPVQEIGPNPRIRHLSGGSYL